MFSLSKQFLILDSYMTMTNPHNQEIRIRESFKLFDLPIHATKSHIKNRYKSLAKIWHPDISVHNDSEQKFKELNDAYAILIDYKKQDVFVLKPDDYYLKKSQKDLKKESYRKTIKAHLIAFYKTKPLSSSSVKQSRKDFWLININFIFSVVIVLVFPPILTISYGWEGLMLSAFLIIFLSLFIMSAVRNLHRTNVLHAIKRLLNR
jgi:DnaJ-domain-containing protein 1